MRRLAAILALACMSGCALFRSSGPAPELTAEAAKSALVAAYEARMHSIVNASTSCTQALHDLATAEADFTAVWQGLKVQPEPAHPFTCKEVPQ